MTSRILGVVREQVLASFFGAGAAMDAYNVAFRIPNLLRDLFAEGAMSAAFVPTFTTSVTTSGKESAWRLGNHVVNALIVVTGALVVLGIVFMEPLILSFAAEKYTSDPKRPHVRPIRFGARYATLPFPLLPGQHGREFGVSVGSYVSSARRAR